MERELAVDVNSASGFVFSTCFRRDIRHQYELSGRNPIQTKPPKHSNESIKNTNKRAIDIRETPSALSSWTSTRTDCTCLSFRCMLSREERPKFITHQISTPLLLITDTVSPPRCTALVGLAGLRWRPMDQRGGVGAITQAGGVHEAHREDGTVHIAVPTPVLRALTIQTPDNCQRSDRGVWALPEFMTQDPESFEHEETRRLQTTTFTTYSWFVWSSRCPQ